MALLTPKPGPKQDFKEVKEIIKKEDSKTINALPDFEIRTMKNDLAGLGVKRGDKNLLLQKRPTISGISPVVPKPETTIPKTGEEIKKQTPEIKYPKESSEPMKKPESGMIVPENLPIPETFKKSSLPSTEELIRKTQESPLAPLPPKEPETFFVTEEEPKERDVQKIIKTPEFPQTEKLKIPEPVYAPEKEKIRKILKFAVIGIIALAVIGAGAFIYFKNKNQESEPIVVIKPEPQLSAPIISMEDKKILSLPAGSSLLQVLREEAKKEQAIQSFKRIGILRNETEFLSLAEILQGLEIPISPYVFSELKDNYNLFIFNQQTGKRLGIIIETNNSENLKSQMMGWEPTMLNEFKNLYLAELPGQPASKDFLNDNYKNVVIRYKNLPYSTLTLNYTILGNFLIIGTSKELIYSTIDRILLGQ